MAKEKIQIDIPDGQFTFVPPIAELMGWLRGPTGLHTYLHWMQEDKDLDLRAKVDLKTLRKASQEGVTLRTADTIKMNIHEFARVNEVLNFLDEASPAEPVVKGSNGMKWLQLLRGSLLGFNRHQTTKLNLPRTFAFLEQRAHAERRLILAFKKNASREAKLSQAHAVFIEICRCYTLLDAREAEVYGSAIVDAVRSGRPRTKEGVGNASRLIFRLRVDFYHQLLANFMADMLPLREVMRLPPSLDDALVNHGAMGQLMPLLEQGELKTPTQRIYEYWRGAFLDSGDAPLSYRYMAKNVPKPEPERTRVREHPGSDDPESVLQSMEDAVDDTRRTLLKDWRKGTVPDSEKLTGFLQSLSGESYDEFLPFIMTRVATAWSEWIKGEVRHVDALVKEDPFLADYLNIEWLVCEFSLYPEYWRHATAQETSGPPGP